MDVNAIKALGPKLASFLNRFAHCGCDAVFAHVRTYVEGQLTELERKNVEQIALNAGFAPRTLQEFLSNLDWDYAAIRDQIAKIVASEQSGNLNIGIIDDTSFVKKGDKTPSVQ